MINAKDQKQGERIQDFWRGQVYDTLLNRVFRVGLFEKVRYEQSPKRLDKWTCRGEKSGQRD